jgi:PAS domain S-box-containing protein
MGIDGGRLAKDFGRALAGSPLASSAASKLAAALIVALAAVPFAGWRIPLAWLAIMAVLAGFHGRRTPGKADAIGADGWFDPTSWLISAGFSAAAFYLVFSYGGAAQTLGVTLYGVIMFSILARDYASPRRLLVNLLAPIVAVVVVQAAATTLLLARGLPWQLITLLASPLLVFRTFRVVQGNLEHSRRQEREALARLAESEARYRLLAEHAPDVIVRYDTAGRIEYASPAARRYGAEPDALIGRNVEEFLDPAERERNRAFLASLARGETLPQGEQNVWRSWMPNGGSVLFEGATSPIADADGKIAGAMAVLRDVTARRALEDELRRKREEAEAATVAKSQFLANMSHEIRTPLTGVIGFAGLLGRMEGLPESARRYVERIHNSADALLTVVNDVLDFSKLEANQVVLDAEPADPRAFIAATADLVRDRAAEKGLAIEIDCAPSLPAHLLVDAARLRQVLLNLLTNAVKFTSAGEVAVAAEYDEAVGVFEVSLRDTGVGVAPAVASRLFQRFSQVDGSNARQHGGTGLGLAISKAMVELMGGEIGMESAPGFGSTFWFKVPAPAVEAPGVGGANEAPPLDVARARILVVDDVAVNRELVSAILGALGAEVLEAGSGAEALEASRAAAFDIILMDLQMPGMDGLAATAAIRAEGGPNALTPIIALSANVLPAQVESCLAAGMDDHIGKPIDPAELITKVAQWACGRAAEPEADRVAAGAVL